MSDYILEISTSLFKSTNLIIIKFVPLMAIVSIVIGWHNGNYSRAKSVVKGIIDYLVLCGCYYAILYVILLVPDLVLYSENPPIWASYESWKDVPWDIGEILRLVIDAIPVGLYYLCVWLFRIIIMCLSVVAPVVFALKCVLGIGFGVSTFFTVLLYSVTWVFFWKGLDFFGSEIGNLMTIDSITARVLEFLSWVLKTILPVVAMKVGPIAGLKKTGSEFVNTGKKPFQWGKSAREYRRKRAQQKADREGEQSRSASPETKNNEKHDIKSQDPDWWNDFQSSWDVYRNQNIETKSPTTPGYYSNIVTGGMSSNGIKNTPVNKGQNVNRNMPLDPVLMSPEVNSLPQPVLASKGSISTGTDKNRIGSVESSPNIESKVKIKEQSSREKEIGVERNSTDSNNVKTESKAVLSESSPTIQSKGLDPLLGQYSPTSTSDIEKRTPMAQRSAFNSIEANVEKKEPKASIEQKESEKYSVVNDPNPSLLRKEPLNDSKTTSPE